MVDDPIRSAFTTVARSALAMHYYYCPMSESKHIVEVVKDRNGNPSRHEFCTLKDALAYMEHRTNLVIAEREVHAT